MKLGLLLAVLLEDLIVIFPPLASLFDHIVKLLS